MDNSIIRVKVKTNRFLNLFVSIQTNKSIQELSDRIIECFYELDDEDASEEAKEKNVKVIALNFDGFFISKSENVANILKDGDEIECIFSGSKLRYSASSLNSGWKNGNKWESRQSNNSNNSNNSYNSYNSNNSNKNYRGYEMERNGSKRERKKNKMMSKDRKRKEYVKKEETRDISMKSRNSFYPFTIHQKLEETQMKVEFAPIKFPSFGNHNSDDNKEEIGEIQENTGFAEGSEQDDIDGQPENEDKNLKLLQDEKQAEDKICDSPQNMTKKESALENDPNKTPEEESDLRVSLPSKETKFVQEPSITQQSEINDIIELSSKMTKKTSNKLNKTESKCVKLEHSEIEATNDEGIGKGIIMESGDSEQNDNTEKSESKVWNKKFEKSMPDENKFEGIIYCYKKEKENEEISKTFIETESETDSFELTSSIGEQAPLLKEVSFTLKAKHSKNKIKFEERL